MLRLSVGGDAEGGWMVDIHDGEKNGCYRSEGDTPVAALVAAIKEHDPALLDELRAAIPSPDQPENVESGHTDAGTEEYRATPD